MALMCAATLVLVAGNASAANYTGPIPWPTGSAPNVLWPGDHVIYGGYALRMQATDGNLVLYNATGRACWSSRTNGNQGAYAAYQHDGNFVVYKYVHGPALWASNTAGKTGTRYNVSINGGQLYVADKFIGRC
jgi:hypothetical protein